MYGVPTDLPLARFVGKEMNCIGLGRFQVQFHWSGTGSINVEGRWELCDAAGVRIDKDEDPAERESLRIHRIIDLKVVAFEIEAPRSFTLRFEHGYRLTVFDDTPKYESFSLHFPGEPSWYI